MIPTKNTFLPILLLATLLLTACSNVPLANLPRLERVQTLIAEQRFNAALNQIASAEEADDDYQALRQQLAVIEQQIPVYIDQTLQQANALQDDLAFHEAKQLLTRAIDNLPRKSPGREQVEEQYQQLLQKRDDYIKKQRVRLNVKLGRYLLEEGKYLEKIRDANPSSISSGWEYSGYKRKRREIAEFLSEEGERALAAKKYYSARRYLSLSQELLPDDATEAMLAQAKQKIAGFKSLKQQEQEDNYQQLVNRFKTLRAAQDYHTAKEVLATLFGLKPQDAQLLQQQMLLEGDIAAEVNQALLDGQERYSAGEVREALIIWKQAANLSPENLALQQSIERAERFLENYQSLQQAADE